MVTVNSVSDDDLAFLEVTKKLMAAELSGLMIPCPHLFLLITFANHTLKDPTMDPDSLMAQNGRVVIRSIINSFTIDEREKQILLARLGGDV